MRATCKLLGTGASHGIPLIGCRCAVCSSTDPRNRRLRPSALINARGKQLLIDVGPDFRQQALMHNIDRLDGLVLTHTHYDHIAGIDELRILNMRQKGAIPCLLSQMSLSDLKTRYDYLFRERSAGHFPCAQLDYSVMSDDEGVIEFAGVIIGYTSYYQRSTQVNGFRIGKFAYIADIRQYPETIFSFLEGTQHLVLGALGIEPSPVHFSLQEAAEFAQKVDAKETWLVHLCHAVDHEAACLQLPKNIRPAFDGQEIVFEI